MAHHGALRRRDLAAAAGLLGRRFTDDPVWRTIGPRRRPHRRVVCTLSMAVELWLGRRCGGWLYGAHDGPRLVAALVVWPMPEGRLPWWGRVLQTLPWLLAGPLPGARAMRMTAQFEALHPDEPFLHGWLLAAEEDAPRAGRDLISRFLQDADRDGRPVCIESSAARLESLYAGFGCLPVGRIPLPGFDPAVVMRREPPPPAG